MLLSSTRKIISIKARLDASTHNRFNYKYMERATCYDNINQNHHRGDAVPFHYAYESVYDRGYARPLYYIDCRIRLRLASCIATLKRSGRFATSKTFGHEYGLQNGEK